MLLSSFECLCIHFISFLCICEALRNFRRFINFFLVWNFVKEKAERATWFYCPEMDIYFKMMYKKIKDFPVSLMDIVCNLAKLLWTCYHIENIVSGFL